MLREEIDFLKAYRHLMAELEYKFPDSQTNALSNIVALFSSVTQPLLARYPFIRRQ